MAAPSPAVAEFVGHHASEHDVWPPGSICASLPAAVDSRTGRVAQFSFGWVLMCFYSWFAHETVTLRKCHGHGLPTFSQRHGFPHG